MATLPQTVTNDSPGTTSICLYVGGTASGWRESWVIQDGGSPVDLTGVSAELDFRSACDDRIILGSASVTSPTLGAITLSLTEAQVASFPLPGDAPRAGNKLHLGRFNLALIDDVGRWVIARGDVWGIR